MSLWLDAGEVGGSLGNTYTYSGEGRQMVIRDIMWYLQRVQARRRGRYDGAQGVPILDESSTFPPGEFRLKQMTDRALEELARHWAHIDRRLKGRYCGMLRELRLLKVSLTETEFELRRFKVTHDDNMNGINQDRKVKRTKWGPEHEWRLNPLGYLMFMLAILIGEFPLNAIAFRLFGEAEVLTYVMTLVLAVSLVGCAHVLGIFLSLEKPTIVQRVLLAVCIVAPVRAIFAIAELMQEYRTSNLDARKEKTAPAIFKNQPEFTLAMTIQVLDWYCPQVPDLVATSRVLTSSEEQAS